MSDEELALAGGLTAEEELLQWAAEPEAVSVRLRNRVLSAVRERVRRRQARREMQWAAAGLLTWAMMTHGKSAATSVDRAQIMAVAPFLGNQRLPAGADAERSDRSSRDGLMSRGAVAKVAVDMRRLDDLVWSTGDLKAGLATRHALDDDARDFWSWSVRHNTETT